MMRCDELGFPTADDEGRRTKWTLGEWWQGAAQSNWTLSTALHVNAHHRVRSTFSRLGFRPALISLPALMCLLVWSGSNARLTVSQLHCNLFSLDGVSVTL